MNLEKLRLVLEQAKVYKIECRYRRTGDFDYTVYFNEEVYFTDWYKADKFIDALVEKEKLTKVTPPYRVGFGWEIY